MTNIVTSTPAPALPLAELLAQLAALPADHPLARLQRVPLERLKDERFLAFERHHGPLMFDTVIATCMRHGFSPRLFPARQMHTILSLVSGGVVLIGGDPGIGKSTLLLQALSLPASK